MDAVQRPARMAPADLRHDAVEAALAIGLGVVGDLRAPAEPGLGERQLDHQAPGLRGEEVPPGGEVVDVGVRLVGLLVDLQAALDARHPDLAALQRLGVQPRDDGRVHDHGLQVALVERAAHQLQVRAVERVEGAEEHADAAARVDDGAQVGQHADAEDQRAEADSGGEEGLARPGQAGGAEGGHHDVRRQPRLDVAVAVAQVAVGERDAEVLRALRGERGEHGGRRHAADAVEPGRAQRAAGRQRPQGRQVEGELGGEAPEPAERHHRQAAVDALLDAVGGARVERQQQADHRGDGDQRAARPGVVRAGVGDVQQCADA